MRHHFFDIAFTPAVLAEQARRGSRAGYAAAEGRGDHAAAMLTATEIGFITERDSFYMATVSETGWPYVQHRGGPPGFVRHVNGTTIGWAEFAGNRQYISAGNTAADDRVALIFVDYPHRERLKLLGHLLAYEPAERPDLALVFSVERYRARIERLVTVTVEAFDWNCPQHITPRYTLEEVEHATAPLRARIAELETQLSKSRVAAG
jgi:predicted pyridoxine 5'-phosphate oxidase superfamily flavin-nucleotide-binding protein